MLLTGDTMTGNLNITRDPDTTGDGTSSLNLVGRQSDANTASAHVSFHNENAGASQTGFLEFYSDGGTQYFKFDKDVDLGSRNLKNANSIAVVDSGYLKAVGTNRIRLRQNGTASNTEGSAAVRIESPGESKRCFAIRGRRSNGAEGDLLWTDKDTAYYDGRVAGNTHIANKKYVDDKVKNAVDNIDVSGPNDYVRTTSTSYNASIKLYKENGIFYITGG